MINSRDITDRKRTETEIVRLAALSRENPNPVLECDEEGRSLHVNPAAQRIDCEFGQGVLFARPIPATDIDAMLDDRWSWTG